MPRDWFSFWWQLFLLWGVVWVFCLVVYSVVVVLFFHPQFVLLCVLQCDINLRSLVSWIHCGVFISTIYISWYVLISLVSGKPIPLILVGEICSVSWVRSFAEHCSYSAPWIAWPDDRLVMDAECTGSQGVRVPRRTGICDYVWNNFELVFSQPNVKQNTYEPSLTSLPK